MKISEIRTKIDGVTLTFLLIALPELFAFERTYACTFVETLEKQN